MSSRSGCQSDGMEHGVVALLDALGIGKIWAERKDIHEVVNSWNNVLESFSESVRKKTHDYHFLAFSDTIIIILVGKDLDLVYKMGEILIDPFIDAMVKNGVFLRGVISKGAFLFTPTMITGPAISEAQQWYTQPEWIGISTTPTATFALMALESQGKDVGKCFIKWRVPLKGGRDQEAWALAWPAQARGKELDILNQFATRVIGPDVYPKYENTLCFFDYVVQRKQAPSDVSLAWAKAVKEYQNINIDSALQKLLSRWQLGHSERERLKILFYWLLHYYEGEKSQEEK